MKNENKDKKIDKKRIVTYIIILVLVILLLLSSCGLGSSFFGKIGKLIRNAGNFIFNNNQTERVVTKNKELKFDLDSVNLTISDENTKVSFTLDKIHANKFSCYTDDSSIATCYVKDDYVVVNPKKTGSTTLTLSTEVNDKEYIATTKINVTLPNKKIVLSSTSGTINLAYSSVKTISYNLENVSGNVSATSSDLSIASASCKNGILTIKGHKKGIATITLTIDDTTASYVVEVINKTYSSNTTKKTTKTTGTTTTTKKASTKGIKDIKLNNGSIGLKFDKDTNSYVVNVDKDTYIIKLNVDTDSGVKLTYLYDGKTYDSLDSISLKDGENVIYIISEYNGEVKTYKIIINKEEDSKEPKLLNIVIDNGNIPLNFNSTKKNYTVRVNNDVDKITIGAISNDDVTYTFNGKTYNSFKNIGISEGDNVIDINVTKNGITEKYTLTIVRPTIEHTYKIELDNKSYTCNLENDTCTISYAIYKDGIEISDYDVKDVNITLNNYSGTYNIAKGAITLTPNKVASKNDKATLTLSYNGSSTDVEVTFKTRNYKVDTNKKEYDVITTGEDKEKNIVVYTDMFTKKPIKRGNDRDIKLCTDISCMTYIEISTDSDIITLDYDNKEDAPTSLNIKVKSNGSGSAKINVKGVSLDDEFENFDIKLNITNKHIIKISAHGRVLDNKTNKYVFDENDNAKFNDVTSLYEFIIGENETINLTSTLYDIPYKVSDDPCKSYEFVGFAPLSINTNEIIYTYSEISTAVSNTIDYSKGDLELVSIYSDVLTYTPASSHRLYLADVPLFKPESEEDTSKNEYMISPGSKGDYTMNFKNESDSDITITDIELTEENICISGKCLNMGYIINDSLGNFHYGTSNTYKVLHTDTNEYGEYDVKIASDKRILLHPNDWVEYTIHWKWVEIDDEADTVIGSFSNLDDKYTLTVAIKYDKSSICK